MILLRRSEDGLQDQIYPDCLYYDTELDPDTVAVVKSLLDSL